MTPDQSARIRAEAVERVAYLLRLADALDARGIVICGVAALELRTIAEGVRVSPNIEPPADAR